jgi:hypothetical protein
MCDCQNKVQPLNGLLSPYQKCSIYQTVFDSQVMLIAGIGGPLVIAGITYLYSKPNKKFHNIKTYGVLGSLAYLATYAAYGWFGRKSCS